MVLLKREIEDQQSNFELLRADTEKLSDDQNQLLEDVFRRNFMKKYTRYDNIDKFISDSPANIDHRNSFQTREFERFVSKNTVFDDWDEMKSKASENWIVSELDL